MRSVTLPRRASMMPVLTFGGHDDEIRLGGRI